MVGPDEPRKWEAIGLEVGWVVAFSATPLLAPIISKIKLQKLFEALAEYANAKLRELTESLFYHVERTNPTDE